MEIIKKKIYIDVRPSSAFTQGYGIFQPSTKILNTVPESDFYINIPLKRTYNIYEYVDTQKDENIESIPRQEINPFFLEYSFFDSTKRNKVNNSKELSSVQLNFIRSKRSDVSMLNDENLKNWFDERGKNELPWTDLNGESVSIYDIELSQMNLATIVSKANFLNIDIYR